MSQRRSTGSQIPQFYAGRSIFITGATGFMGKVLVERLLSTCPDVGRLYLLMRTKRGILPEKRLLQLKQTQVFDAIRERNPSQLEKLCIIPGDVTQPQCGVTPESMALLQEVSIVFHSAATVKFDEELRTAVDQNVRSAIRIMDICDRLPNVEAFIHVSTAYSNSELECIDERVYPPPAPVDQLLALVDSAPTHLLAEITAKYIHPKPNTYTFTKAVAESVVEQHTDRGYSVAIFRPSIVISACKHPFPGWIENLNGPSGVIVGAGKGLLHIFCSKADARADMLPVDIAIDTLLAIGWETAIDKLPEARVYNCSTYDNPTTWGAFEKAIRTNLRKHPLDNTFWYPSGASVENTIAGKVLEVLLHTIPLYLAEYMVKLFGVKMQVSLITADQKIRAMNKALRNFSRYQWRFETGNWRRLRERLSPEDAETYNLDPHSINWDEHYTNFVIGTRRYLLKEKDQDLPEARKHSRRMGYLHRAVLFISLLLFIRLVLQNQIARDIVYGTIRFLISLFNAAYMRITTS